jgi:DNA-binding XRE family transcriptional regulator
MLRIAESYQNAIAASYAPEAHNGGVKKRSFWLRVQEAMRDKGMDPTQKAAGQLIGISQPSVNKWTKGGQPRMEHCVALANKLGVCVEWLYTERGAKHPLDAESSYLLNTFNSIKSDRTRDKVLAYIDAMIDRAPSRDDDLEQDSDRPTVS